MQNKAIVDVLRGDLEALNVRWVEHWESATIADRDGDEAARAMHDLMLDFFSEMAKVIKGTIDVIEHDG